MGLFTAASGVRAVADTLDEACWMAVATDQSIRSSQMEAHAARWQYRAAKGGRLPQVRAMSEYVVLSDRPGINVDMAPMGTLSTPILNKDFNVTTASLTQPIWTGGQVKWAVNAAASQVSAAEQSVTTTVQDVKLAAVTSYVTVLRAQRLLEVAMSNVRSLQSHVRDVSSMLEQGMVAKNDYLAAEVALANAVQARRRAIAGLETARASYNRQVGRPLATPVSLAQIDLPPSSEDPDALTFAALRNRSELATLAAQANALRSQAKQAKAENMPTVACGGTFAHVDNSTIEPNDIWLAHCGLNWFPYDGGVARSRANSYFEKAESLMRARADARTKVALQVRTAWLDEQETRDRIRVTETAIAQAEENLRVAKLRFDQGKGTNTEVLDAETARTQTFSNYYNALYDAILATYRLRRAMGVL